MKHSLRDLYRAGLAATGWSLAPQQRSSRYETWTKNGYHIWLGKSAALRFGQLDRIDASIPVGENNKARLKAEGLKRLESKPLMD